MSSGGQQLYKLHTSPTKNPAIAGFFVEPHPTSVRKIVKSVICRSERSEESDARALPLCIIDLLMPDPFANVQDDRLLLR